MAWRTSMVRLIFQVAATAFLVDVAGVPVNLATGIAGFQVNQVDAAMTFNLVDGADDGCGDDRGESVHDLSTYTVVTGSS